MIKLQSIIPPLRRGTNNDLFKISALGFVALPALLIGINVGYFVVLWIEWGASCYKPRYIFRSTMFALRNMKQRHGQRLLRSSLFAFAILVFANASFAEDSDFVECRQMFAFGKPPVLQNQPELKLRALCFSSFAVLHSGLSHTPIYVAERLNKTRLLEAKGVERTNRFYTDARLPREERAELEDYKNSGFDRGHMAPAADMVTGESMAQSFSLANMVPQYPVNNRKSWASIEKATRKYVMRASGDVYVITGPVFESKPPTIGLRNIWVPQHLFKLVYDPATKRAWAHWLDNSNAARVGKPISYNELVCRTGVDFLLGLER